jgi:hypothetical protein
MSDWEEEGPITVRSYPPPPPSRERESGFVRSEAETVRLPRYVKPMAERAAAVVRLYRRLAEIGGDSADIDRAQAVHDAFLTLFRLDEDFDVDGFLKECA